MLQVIKMKSRHMSITPKIGNYDSKHETVQSFRRDGLNFINENEKSSSKKINNKFNESISSKSNSLKNSFESSSNSSFDSYYNTSVLDKRLIKSSKHSSIHAAKFKWKKALGAIRFKNMLLKEKASEFGEDNDDGNDDTNDIEKQKDNYDDDFNRSEHSLSATSINNFVASQGSKNNSSQNKQTTSKFNNNNSYFRSAIPCLPLTLSIICLTANICIPGFGKYIIH
jgi:hypothetical protein